MTKKKKHQFLSGVVLTRVLLLIVFGSLSALGLVMQQSQRVVAAENAELREVVLQMIDIQSEQQDMISELATQLSVELEGLREETSQQLADARRTVAATRRELEDAISEQDTLTVTEVVNSWRPRIAFIRCEFNFLGARVAQQGAATLFESNEGEPILATNRHVIQAQASQFLGCYYRFPQDTDNIQFPEEAITLGSSVDEQLENPDFATVLLTEPNSFVREQLENLEKDICTAEPLIGDEVVILGFPTIGSTRDLTATEGIIAAVEDHYFVTSAKVDSGNSGGAAIHVEQNCYLGIPTFTALGQAESLARILRADAVVLD